MAVITWNRGDNSLRADGVTFGTSHNANPEFLAEIADVRNLEIEDLGAILSSIRDDLGLPNEYVSLAVWHDENQEDMSIFYPSYGGRVKLSFGIDRPIRNQPQDIVQQIKPMLTAIDWNLTETSYRERGGADFSSDALDFDFDIPSSSTVGRAVDILTVIKGVVTRRTASLDSPLGVHSLILRRQVAGLLGQTESQWLEAKGKGYGFENDRQKHEVALDMAAFANADSGGVLVIGFVTRPDASSQDTIVSAPGCASGSLIVDTYAQILHDRIVPPVEGLDIRLVEADGRHYLSIYVPPQANSLKPFLVKGAVMSADRWTSAAFSIPTRRGSSKREWTADRVHALLVAGRAARADLDVP